MEYNVAADHTAANEMMRISGQRGVPVIVIDGNVVVGFDRPRLEQLLAQAQAQPQLSPEIGLAVTAANFYAAKHGLHLPEGAYIGRVKPGSSAARAGLQAGDVITQVGGRPIHDDVTLQEQLAALRGQRVSMRYWRNGESRATELAL